MNKRKFKPLAVFVLIHLLVLLFGCYCAYKSPICNANNTYTVEGICTNIEISTYHNRNTRRYIYDITIDHENVYHISAVELKAANLTYESLESQLLDHTVMLKCSERTDAHIEWISVGNHTLIDFEVGNQLNKRSRFILGITYALIFLFSLCFMISFYYPFVLSFIFDSAYREKYKKQRAKQKKNKAAKKKAESK